MRRHPHLLLAGLRGPGASAAQSLDPWRAHFRVPVEAVQDVLHPVKTVISVDKGPRYFRSGESGPVCLGDLDGDPSTSFGAGEALAG